MTTQTTRPAAATTTTTLTAPSHIYPATLLQRSITADYLLAIPMALNFTALASPAGTLLGLPTSFTLGLGIFLIFWATFMWRVSRTSPTPLAGTVTILAVNVAWVALSVAIAAGAWFELTTTGIAFVAAQAVAVTAVTTLEVLAARHVYRPATTA
ncbi:MAG: hypothetical protein CVT64_04060 [Actinobacteria bacterium HGW-Actinobacteria-4]|nr:MAG: hypothetical protein CVT64_04060 [Actinobacteria bacterium HGW-Actinobacteria-4]